MNKQSEIDPTQSRLNSVEVIRDPYRFYKMLDEHGGIVWNSAHKSWLIGSYDYVKLLLNHQDASVEKIAPFVAHATGPLREKLQVMEDIIRPWVVFNDPPAHTRIRKVLQRGFMPRDILKLESEIRTTTNDLLDRMVGRGVIDFMADFAYLLPAIVICDMFGISRSKVEQVKQWSDGLSKFILGSPSSEEKYDVGLESILEMHSFLKKMASECDPTTGNSLLHKLVASRYDKDGLSDEEIISSLIMVLFAGHETTANLLANSMLTLVRQKSKMQEVISGKVPVSTAIEELLRYEGPVPVVVRVAAGDIQVGDTLIQKGDRIFLLLHAANRDETQFQNPASIDFGRSKCPHLQFGYGTHVCLGAPLARLEGQIAFEELFKRYVDFEMLDEHIDWRDELMTRGPRTLRMELTPR